MLYIPRSTLRGLLVFLAVAGCGKQLEHSGSWSSLGLFRVTVPNAVLKARAGLTHISTDNLRTLVAINRATETIKVFQASFGTTATLDSVGSVRLPLTGLEGIVRSDLGGSILAVTSERNIWTYSLSTNQVLARTRSFVPLADIAVMSDHRVVVSEYPALNGNSGVLLTGDLRPIRRFFVIPLDSEVTLAPNAHEFLVSTFANRSSGPMGFIAYARLGSLARFAETGLVDEFRPIIDLISPALDLEGDPYYQDHRLAVVDICQWDDGIAVLVVSNRVRQYLVAFLGKEGHLNDATSLDLDAGERVLSIAPMLSSEYMAALIVRRPEAAGDYSARIALWNPFQ